MSHCLQSPGTFDAFSQIGSISWFVTMDLWPRNQVNFKILVLTGNKDKPLCSRLFTEKEGCLKSEARENSCLKTCTGLKFNSTSTLLHGFIKISSTNSVYEILKIVEIQRIRNSSILGINPCLLNAFNLNNYIFIN